MKETPAELTLAAPSHLDFMLSGILTCYNDMKLPPNQRAGPPSLEETRCQPSRRTTPSNFCEANVLALSTDETALSIILQRFADAEHVTVTNANTALPSRLGFRSDQAALCRLFDLAAENQAGVTESAPHANLRLRLTLADMKPEFRRHLNLHLPAPSRNKSLAETSLMDAAPGPVMRGAGKSGHCENASVAAPRQLTVSAVLEDLQVQPVLPNPDMAPLMGRSGCSVQNSLLQEMLLHTELAPGAPRRRKSRHTQW